VASRAQRLARVIAFGLAFASPALALAAPGDKMKIGDPDTPAVFVDDQTGIQYNFLIRANESPVAGRGGATLAFHQDFLKGCSTNGPDIELDENPDGTFSGNAPLTEIHCGNAAAQGVSINGCIVDIEVHGFVHSDAPNTVYMGSTTIDLRYQKMRNNNDKVKLTIYTPKDKTQINGTVVSGAAALTSCP
jgi:hypothetical protein